MLTPFMVGWILAHNLPFDTIAKMTVEDFGGWKYFSEIAVGIAYHNCDNGWEYNEKSIDDLVEQYFQE